MAFTTFTDTAATAVDDRPVPEYLYFAGDQLTFHEVVAEMEAGLGRKLTVVDNGSSRACQPRSSVARRTRRRV